ncbi:S26 family signal peptidase [Amycolatopsis azurea]|uniref:signal peptidase I n=2 Tax=Amycolatopsis azurea DSM 43854 TaxID=1238180 RepID=M2QUW3_9PSEU|nr:S26 family signal peptidase [Amycolatopsis azurea]EMD29777.1 Signal peptidase I [Amycolatopsis azurea DSM 43854]
MKVLVWLAPGAFGLMALRWVRRRWAVIAVTGSSMTPTFHEGDRVLARQRPKAFAVGDVVVLETPGSGSPPVRRTVKRVVAVGGDTVPEEAAGLVAAGAVVPPRHLVVLGDNRTLSADSRHQGYFPVDRVFGLVLRRLG